MFRRVEILVVPIALAAMVSACGMPCEETSGVTLCGEFGSQLPGVDLDAMWGEVAWPPVITEQGDLILARSGELLGISNDGSTETIASADGSLSPASLSGDGTIYTVDSGLDTKLMAVDEQDEWDPIRYGEAIPGERAVSPPAIGNGLIHVNARDFEGGSYTVSINPTNMEVEIERPRTSMINVTRDGTLRFLKGAIDCWDTHDELVAEDADGNELWTYQDQSGLLDFAPGGDGETYVVNGNRELVRVSAEGEMEWSFMPDCEDCNVAAAPTVTKNAVYFPVWVGWVPANSCGGEQAEMPPEDDAFDPLYALTHDGELLWVYDGFLTQAVGMTWPVPIYNETVHHHPSGRPVVAEDGTLFIATDGAVVSLDSDGFEIGRAIYDSGAGEHSSNWGETWGTTGLAAPPVLAPDGTLYVFDGVGIFAFDTGKPAAEVPWQAPFGGPTNDGRVR